MSVQDQRNFNDAVTKFQRTVESAARDLDSAATQLALAISHQNFMGAATGVSLMRRYVATLQAAARSLPPFPGLGSDLTNEPLDYPEPVNILEGSGVEDLSEPPTPDEEQYVRDAPDEAPSAGTPSAGPGGARDIESARDIKLAKSRKKV